MHRWIKQRPKPLHSQPYSVYRDLITSLCLTLVLISMDTCFQSIQKCIIIQIGNRERSQKIFVNVFVRHKLPNHHPNRAENSASLDFLKIPQILLELETPQKIPWKPVSLALSARHWKQQLSPCRMDLPVEPSAAFCLAKEPSNKAMRGQVPARRLPTIPHLSVSHDDAKRSDSHIRIRTP